MLVVLVASFLFNSYSAHTGKVQNSHVVSGWREAVTLAKDVSKLWRRMRVLVDRICAVLSPFDGRRGCQATLT